MEVRKENKVKKTQALKWPPSYGETDHRPGRVTQGRCSEPRMLQKSKDVQTTPLEDGAVLRVCAVLLVCAIHFRTKTLSPKTFLRNWAISVELAFFCTLLGVMGLKKSG